MLAVAGASSSTVTVELSTSPSPSLSDGAAAVSCASCSSLASGCVSPSADSALGAGWPSVETSSVTPGSAAVEKERCVHGHALNPSTKTPEMRPLLKSRPL